MSIAKRACDVAGALAGLAVFAPAMALIAIAIVADDGGPILFRQVRVGRRRRPFEILKFRSMRDGRVTRVGRRLRATGLDEIVQFVNILRGEMSAVGPRPLTAEDVERLGWKGPDADFRWELRPGLTGVAQLLGATSARESLEHDRVYAANPSLALDVACIALSFAVNAFGKARVRQWIRRPRLLGALIGLRRTLSRYWWARLGG